LVKALAVVGCLKLLMLLISVPASWSTIGSTEVKLFRTCMGDQCMDTVDLAASDAVQATQAFVLISMFCCVGMLGALLFMAVEDDCTQKYNLGVSPSRLTKMWACFLLMGILEFSSMCSWAAWQADVDTGLSFSLGFEVTAVSWLFSFLFAAVTSTITSNDSKLGMEPVASTPKDTATNDVVNVGKDGIPDPWQEHQDVHGNVYYFNPNTEESRWERPT
jgi:hypothetical protein